MEILAKYDYDIRSELSNKKFENGRHLIKTTPNGQKIFLSFKDKKITGIDFTDKNGKKHKVDLSKRKIANNGPLPGYPYLYGHVRFDLCFSTDTPNCRIDHVFIIVLDYIKYGLDNYYMVTVSTCCD